MDKQWIPFFFHLIVFIHYVWVEYYFTHYVELPSYGLFEIFHSYGGRWKFLTIWNMVFQAAFFGICLINDVFGTNEPIPAERCRLRQLKDYLHACIGIPLSLFVGTSFWTLWTIDRQLVFPKELDVYFPTWLNHSMHSLILIFTAGEILISHNEYPSWTVGLTTIGLVAAFYILSILAVYLGTGMWIYPILGILTWIQKFIFVTVAVSCVLSMYFIGEFVNAAIWRKYDTRKLQDMAEKSM